MLIENFVRGGISSVMGDRYVKSDEKKKILYFDPKNLYVHAMSRSLPDDEIKFDGNVKLKDKLNTHDDSDTVYFVEVDLKYRDKIKEKTKYFPFLP